MSELQSRVVIVCCGRTISIAMGDHVLARLFETLSRWVDEEDQGRWSRWLKWISLSNDDSLFNFRSSEQSLWKDFNLSQDKGHWNAEPPLQIHFNNHNFLSFLQIGDTLRTHGQTTTMYLILCFSYWKNKPTKNCHWHIFSADWNFVCYLGRGL